MDNQDSARAKLDACHYILLTKLEATPSLDLIVHVVEAKVQDHLVSAPTGINSIDDVVGPAYPIVTKEGCSAFTIVFEGYISFFVTNEFYSVPEDQEDYSRRLRTYKTSKFLDFVSKRTWALSAEFEPVVHFGIICEHHVIDVACASEPMIEHRLVTADDL